MATLACNIVDSEKVNDTNIVKIAMTKYKKNIFRAIILFKVAYSLWVKKIL